MGGFQFKAFVRNDDVPGQGKELLLFVKAMHITTYELDRMYYKFNLLSNNSPFVDIATLFAVVSKKVKYRFFDEVLFQLFDDHKTGKLNFQEFLVIMWAFLTTDEQLLAILCFSLFDVAKLDCLDITEITYLVNIIWNFTPSRSTLMALKKLESNADGIITLQEFVLLCKHHSDVLAPVRKVRNELRKAFIFSRFWTDMMKKRVKHFGAKSILDLRANPLNINFAQLSMDYINLRTDVVPAPYIEQYCLLQKKRARSFKGQVEIPYELLQQVDAQSSTTQLQALRNYAQSMAAKVQPKLGVYLEDGYAI